jgi:hypothetical protein
MHTVYMKLHKHFDVDAVRTFFFSPRAHWLSGWVFGFGWPLTHHCFQSAHASLTGEFD